MRSIQYTLLTIVQNTLLTIVATVFGGVSGCFATYLAMSSMFNEPRGGNFGGGLVWLACTALGGALMALAGLVGALYWVHRHESRPWSPLVWLGIALGLSVGLAVQFGSFDAFFQSFFQRFAVWLKDVFVSGAYGVVGGVLARLAPTVGQQSRRRRNPAPGPARPRR